MEKAIFVSKIKHLKYVNETFTRLYFGNEFCERLLPSAYELKKVLKFVYKKSIAFTFVTPYVTNKGLLNLDKLFSAISNQSNQFENKSKSPSKNQSEIVINDWGVLELIKEKKPANSELVLGRLLTKMKRGPRILNFKCNKITETHFKRSNIELPIFQKFLIENDIKRVELDNLLQGIDFDFSKNVLKASLYYPYLYVATTRRCITNSCDLLSAINKIGIFPCNKECQKYTLRLKHEYMPKTILLKGNTQFIKNQNIPEGLGERGINRLIYQPKIPI